MIQSQQNTPNFRARLFVAQPMAKLGDKARVKAFSQPDILKGIDAMAERGSAATDIFISKIVNDEKENNSIIKFVLKNPLFQDFQSEYGISTNGNNKNDLEILDQFTGSATKNSEILEDMALASTIKTTFFEKIDTLLENFQSTKDLCQILANAFKNNEIPQAKNILSEMLAKIPQKAHGFSDKRIKDFEQIADKMQQDYETFIKEEILPNA